MKNMKVLILFSLFSILGSIAFGQVNQTNTSNGNQLMLQNCNNLNKTINDPSNTALLQLVRSIESTGFIKFDLEQLQKNGDITEQMHLLGITPVSTFEITRKAKDLNNPDITYMTTQQFYNGVLVEGAGYTIGTINCFTMFINAYIAEDIGMNLGSLTPSNTKLQAVSILQNKETNGMEYISEKPEDDMQLVIDRNLKQSCDYVLAWKMSYRVENMAKTAYVNANSGEVYKEVSDVHSLLAPTVDYGGANYNLVELDDRKISGSNITQLRTPDNSVRTFDKTNSNYGGLSGTLDPFNPSILPFSLAPNVWSYTDYDRRVYQAHYVTTNAKDVLEGVGLSFPSPIYVAGNMNDKEARWLTGNNTVSGLDIITYGRLDDGTSLALFDIGGHELTHAYLTGILGNGGESAAIEESLCDIFGTLAENLISGSHDWIMGGDNGLDIRDMANPDISTYQGIGSESNPHKVAGPMNRWFTIIAGAFGIDNAADIVLASINPMMPISNYLDMRAATIMAAEQLYGECHWKVKYIADKWHLVGVGGQYLACIYIDGNRNYCEEYLGTSGGNIDLTFAAPLPGHTYTWYFPYGWTAIGQSAPGIYNGTHLRITGYDNMTSFPLFYTIKVKEYDNSSGTPVLTRQEDISIKINDCDNDDPDSCKEGQSFFITGGETNSIQPFKQKKKVMSLKENNIVLIEPFDSEMDYYYSVYAISGQQVISGKLSSLKTKVDLPQTGMYIIHISDGKKKIIQTEKLVYIKQ